MRAAFLLLLWSEEVGVLELPSGDLAFIEFGKFPVSTTISLLKSQYMYD
jgi:hypothetical protein